MKGRTKKACYAAGGVADAEPDDDADDYKRGGKVKTEAPMMGDRAKKHLGRGMAGKFAMGGVVKYPAEERMKD